MRKSEIREVFEALKSIKLWEPWDLCSRSEFSVILTALRSRSVLGFVRCNVDYAEYNIPSTKKCAPHSLRFKCQSLALFDRKKRHVNKRTALSKGAHLCCSFDSVTSTCRQMSKVYLPSTFLSAFYSSRSLLSHWNQSELI